MSTEHDAAVEALDRYAWVMGDSYLDEHEKIDGLVRALHAYRRTLPERIPERPEEVPEEVEPLPADVQGYPV